jgi:hypothetical protein
MQVVSGISLDRLLFVKHLIEQGMLSDNFNRLPCGHFRRVGEPRICAIDNVVMLEA